MRRSSVLFPVLILIVLIMASGCSAHIVETIPTATPVRTAERTPVPTPVPTPTPEPTPTPLPIEQGHYQIYYRSDSGQDVIRALPQKREEAPLLVLSETPGHLAIEQGGIRIWSEILEDFEGYEHPFPYQRWGVSSMESDRLALNISYSNEILLFSDDLSSCERIPLVIGGRSVYDVRLSRDASQLIYPNGRTAVISSLSVSSREEGVFFDPELFYQADSVMGYIPGDDLILCDAREQVHNRSGYLLAKISTGEKLGFLPDHDDDTGFGMSPDSEPLIPVESDSGVYFSLKQDGVLCFYEWRWQTGRLAPLIRFDYDQEDDAVFRISGGLLYMVTVRERELLTEVYDLKERVCVHSSVLDPSPYAGEDFWDDYGISLPVGSDPEDFWVSLSNSASELVLARTVLENGQVLGDSLPQPEPGPAVQEIILEKDYGVYSERAAVLNEKYGVRLLIGENALLFDMTYHAEPLVTDQEFSNALEQMESVLSTYPEGFFREFTKDGYMRYFYVSLTGAISRKSEDQGIPDVVGYANAEPDRQIICMDTKYNVIGTFYHEVSHAIDSRIAQMENEEGLSCLSEEEWNSMNPPGFTYHYSYLDDDGSPTELTDNGRYTFDYENRDSDCYFVDRYSKTFPTEDRARIIEYASTGYDWMFENSEHLAAKLKWYSELIRRYWDCSGWMEKTPWEKAIPE